MWRGYLTKPYRRGSTRAWLSFVLLAVFGLIVFASCSTAEADLEVGENRCFPVHWCIPGTAGESAIDTDVNVEVGEGRCFPEHWCIPGTSSGERAIEVARTSDDDQP